MKILTDKKYKEIQIKYATLLKRNLDVIKLIYQIANDNNRFLNAEEEKIIMIKEDKNPEFYLYQKLEKSNKEIERLNNIIEEKGKETKQLQEDIVNHIKIASEYKEQMLIKDNIINELEKSWKEQQEYYRYRKDNRYRTFLSKNLEKLKELKEVNKNVERN